MNILKMLGLKVASLYLLSHLQYIVHNHTHIVALAFKTKSDQPTYGMTDCTK